jgi:hypothetical protein
MRTCVKVVALWCVLFILSLVVRAAAQMPSAAGSASAQRTQAYGRLPLSFEPNQGQTSPEVKFLARGAGYGLFLTSTEMVLALRQHPTGSQLPSTTGTQSVLRASLVGANRKPQVLGERELPGKSNYFAGKDPARWRTNVPQFAAVRYRSVYPGVDLLYYGRERQLEYDFVVAPGANPRSIRLRFSGMSGIKLSAGGDLVLALGDERVTVRAPAVYQETEEGRRAVAGRFVLRGGHDVGFDLGPYDKSKALTIDPTVVYSTYFGGAGYDWLAGGAVDPDGNVYLVGSTYSSDFPTTGALNGGGIPDAWHGVSFITKLSAGGQSLVYSTFFGFGTSRGGFDAVAADALGQVYVAGYTYSANMPVMNAVQPACPAGPAMTSYGPADCSSGYVLKLSATGDSLVYATYLGGSQVTWYPPLIDSIATDVGGNTYIATAVGDSTWPLVSPFRNWSGGSSDVYVAKLDHEGGWVYSTYLGGSGPESATSVVADASGNAYIVGPTFSSDFPTANAAQPMYGGGGDGFVTKLSPEGGVVYSTYLGGTRYDDLSSVTVGPDGSAYVMGRAESADFPITPGRQGLGCSEHTWGWGCDRFGPLTKLTSDGQIIFSTAYRAIWGHLALDPSGDIYVASRGPFDRLGGDPSAVPLVNPLMGYAHSFIGSQIFVEKLDPTATTVLFSTWWGGSGTFPLGELDLVVEAYEVLSTLGVDRAGDIYLVGITTNDDFPTLNALQPTPGGPPIPFPDNPMGEIWHENCDIFVTKICSKDNTPAGSQVSVVPADGSSITFDAVSSPGTTSFTRTGDNPWTPPPDGFRLGDPAVYYDISTTASHTGGVTLCVDYSKVSFSVEWGLGLFHYEDGIWRDITIPPVDTANNRICGVATSLSPFAIFGAPLPPVSVVGFAPPLAPLVAPGGSVSWPDKAFKLGRTLPLKLQLLVNGAPLSDQQVQGPKIVEVSRQGDSVLNLDTIDLNTGAANDNGLAFRFSDGSWVYNLSTQGLSPGRYVVTIQLWDGRQLQGGFELKR